MTESAWRVVATCASGFEADLAMALLESAEIPALRDSHDAVGVFGPGYMGSSSHGVTVSVPVELYDEALASITPPFGSRNACRRLSDGCRCELEERKGRSDTSNSSEQYDPVL